MKGHLQHRFPGIRGFSPRNLKYMRALAQAWPESAVVQLPVAQLPWGHHVVLLERLKDKQERLWYAAAALENGWSRNVLTHHIATGGTAGLLTVGQRCLQRTTPFSGGSVVIECRPGGLEVTTSVVGAV